MDIVMVVIGGILIIMGILTCFGLFGFMYGGGKIEADENHKRQYYCFLGAGTMIMGASSCVTGILNLLFQLDLYIVLIIGILVGIILTSHGQTKYGKKRL